MKTSYSHYKESFSWENISKIDAISIDNLKLNSTSLSKLAHDMNSPINLLNLMFNKLESKIDATELEIIKRQLLKLSNLTNQFFSDKLIEEKKLDNKTDLNLAIENIIEDKINQFPDVLIEVTKPFNIENNFFLNIKYFDFLNILSNIFNNSIEARLQNSIKIKIDYNIIGNKYILLSIFDNGKGICPNNLKKIGQYGVTFGKEHLSISGHGIGLYSVKETLIKYSGELNMYSCLGLGTCVTLKLPLFLR